MTRTTAQAEPRQDERQRGPELSPREQEERKQRVLTHGTPSTTRGISEALVIKDGELFLLTEPDGSIPLSAGHGLGLYHHDCRYLSGCELRLGGHPPHPLVSTAQRGFEAIFQLTNPDLRHRGELIPKESLGLIPLSCGQTVPRWVADGVVRPLFAREGAHPPSRSRRPPPAPIHGLFAEQPGSCRKPVRTMETLISGGMWAAASP